MTRIVGNRMLPPGVPEAAIAEVTDTSSREAVYAMATCIGAGVKPKNEAEACTSPDWPHWEGAMCCKIAEL